MPSPDKPNYLQKGAIVRIHNGVFDGQIGMIHGDLSGLFDVLTPKMISTVCHPDDLEPVQVICAHPDREALTDAVRRAWFSTGVGPAASWEDHRRAVDGLLKALGFPDPSDA